MKFILAIFVIIVFTPLFKQVFFVSNSPKFDIDRDQIELNKSKSKPSYIEQFITSGMTAEVHSAALVSENNGSMHAFWYGGTREGATDVSIYTGKLDVKRNQWSKDSILFDRAGISKQLNIFIKKLGNPVAFRDNNGKTWLFFVSVSLGGWAVSSINYVISEDNAQTWSKPKRLVTSPIFNLSTLVKGEPFLYENGNIGLPVYHEMIGKFGELIQLNNDGNVIDKARLSYRRHGMQPIVFPIDEVSARVFLRNATDAIDSTLLETITYDSGKTWVKPFPTNLPNPNAAISGINMSSGEKLLVTNHLYDKRNNLSLLYKSKNFKTWRVIHQFENQENTAKNEYEYSYPTVKKSEDGDYQILYTWNKKHIKHIRFNQAWLEKRIHE